MKEKRLKFFSEMTQLVAAQSNCQRLKVGAVIIDSNDRVLATGYNGTASGFNNCNEFFDAFTCTVSENIHDVLDNVFVIESDSWNTNDCNAVYIRKKYPNDGRNTNDCNAIYIRKECPNDKWVQVHEALFRDLHHMFSELYEIHAEQNALLNLVKTNTSLDRDSSIFITTEPCKHCAKLIVAAGIKRVYYINKYDRSEHSNEVYFKKFGVTYSQLV